jgi:arylsulfatase A-like enzyme
VRKNGEALRDSEQTLAEILGGKGYRTAAVIGSFPLDHTHGFAQGFTAYNDRFEGERTATKTRSRGGRTRSVKVDAGRPADDTRARAVEWLGQNGYLRPPQPGSPQPPPFFLWVHFVDPHDPYDPPAEHRALFPPRSGATDLEREIAAYDGEIHFADAEMGKLLDAIHDAGRLADTLTVITADHGEGLMDHGQMGHGLLLYEAAVRVPFVFHWPARLPAGGVVEAPVQLVDLAPTVLDLLDVAVEAQPEGKSLKGALAGGGGPEAERPVFLQRRTFETTKVAGQEVRGDKSAVRSGKWKYIEAPEENSFELYDLTSDPSEKRNVARAFPREGKALAALLENWQRTSVTPTDVRGPSKEAVERLRALGYVQ